jgi:hypothetical protein
MKPVNVDKLAVVGIGGALVVWTACLVMLWGWALDCSGVTTQLAVAAALLAVSAAIWLPGRAARAIIRLLIRLNLPARREGLERALMLVPTAAGADEAKSLNRLLAIVAALSVLLGALSVMAVFAVGCLVQAWERTVYWTPAAWRAVEMVLLFLGMLPVALGLSVAVLTAAALRIGGGGEEYAAVCREWLWAASAGLAVFAAAWGLGANLLALCAAMGLLLLAASAALLLRRDSAPRPPRTSRPVEKGPCLRRRLGVLAGYAGVAMGLAVQCRLLCDVGGLDLAAELLWTAAALAMLAAFLRRMDDKSHVSGGFQGAAAVIGAVAVFCLQGATAVASLPSSSSGGAAGNAVNRWVCLLLAAGCQVPLAAATAFFLSRDRRLFAMEGGGAKAYVAAAAGGAGLGVLLFLVLASLASGRMWIAVLGLTAMAAAVMATVARSPRTRAQLKWAAGGGVLMAAVAVAMLGAAWRARPLGVTLGAWLSSSSRTAAGTASASPATGLELLPLGCDGCAATWRGRRISGAVRDILAGQKGDWWVIAGSAGDYPNSPPPGVRYVVTAPDPSAVPLAIRRSVLTREGGGDSFDVARLPGDDFDGVLLAPVPGDHAQAWRCYNSGTLARCIRRVHPGHPIVLRTQFAAPHAGEAMSVASTFLAAVGSGWVAAEFGPGQVDLLLCGPAGAVASPALREGLLVSSLEGFVRDDPRAPLLRVEKPAGWLAAFAFTAEEMKKRLSE